MLDLSLQLLNQLRDDPFLSARLAKATVELSPPDVPQGRAVITFPTGVSVSFARDLSTAEAVHSLHGERLIHAGSIPTERIQLTSPSFRDVLELIREAAGVDWLMGTPITGKYLVARVPARAEMYSFTGVAVATLDGGTLVDPGTGTLIAVPLISANIGATGRFRLDCTSGVLSAELVPEEGGGWQRSPAYLLRRLLRFPDL